MFCKHCGNKLEEEAIVCAKCGCLTNGEISKENQKELIVFIKAFGIINCIISCLSLVSVLWCVPMFVLLLYKLENKEYISTSFKWAYLLFCSIPVGFMLFALKLANNINENKESEKIEENSKIYTPKFILMVKCYLIISLVFMGFIFLLSMITANPDIFIISFILFAIKFIVVYYILSLIDNNKKISKKYKIITLIFGSIIAGVLLLNYKEDNK